MNDHNLAHPRHSSRRSSVAVIPGDLVAPFLSETRDMIDQVTQILVDAAEIAIRPRFRQLTQDQVADKAPNDLVTVADL